MENCGRGNYRAHLLVLAVERRGHEHADAHQPRILHLEANLRSTDIRVENRSDIVDSRFEYSAGIRVQTHVRVFTGVDLLQIVLIYIANDPNLGEIGDG